MIVIGPNRSPVRKTVVNKEPHSFSNKEIEIQYKMHRERVISSVPLVDSRLKTYSFMENQSWKKHAEKYRERQLHKNNEIVYERILKVEATESMITKERRKHVVTIENGGKHMKRFRELKRQHVANRIQRENREFHERMTKARPYICNAEFEASFAIHKKWRNAMRSDHTAGHLLDVPKKYSVSTNLPPVIRSTTSVDKILGSVSSVKSAHSKHQLQYGQVEGSKSISTKSITSMSNASILPKIANNLTIADTIDFLYDWGPSPALANINDNNHALVEEDDEGEGYLSGSPGKNYSAKNNSGNSRSQTSSTIQGNRGPSSWKRGEIQDPSRTRNSSWVPPNAVSRQASLLANKSQSSLQDFDSAVSDPHDGDTYMDEYSSLGGGSMKSSPSSPPRGRAHFGSSVRSPHQRRRDGGGASDGATDRSDIEQERLQDDKYLLLASRPVLVPWANKDCLIKVYVSREYNENMYVRAVSCVAPHRLICQRRISIDQAHDIVNSNFAKLASGEDLQSLRVLLVNMFKEADVENHGYLNFVEFQQLVEKIDLGISPQELRFIISEADENENGFIDYHEFVPLAVDMIQAFKARTKGKHAQARIETLIEEEVLAGLSLDELETIAKVCLAKFREADPRGSHVLRLQDLRRCLKESDAGLSAAEVNLIVQSLPRDAVGRANYEEFRKVLYDSRVTVMKNNLVEAQGSDVQRYLMEVCKEEERAMLSVHGEDGITFGHVPLRFIINHMVTSSRLSLSRLQVMVIASEAMIEDGMVDYWSFVPMAARTIEMMFDPKSLRKRAELIERSDLSASSFVEDQTPESMHRKLMTLFKSHDLDKSGDLNQFEFRSCMQSLDLQLEASEIDDLMKVADLDDDGKISFVEFGDFFKRHMTRLERERNIRNIEHEVISSVETSLKTESNPNSPSDKVELYEMQLRKIFASADANKSGFLSVDEFYNIFSSMDINLTSYQMSVLMSELDVNDDGLIDYQEFVPICADLLQAFRGNEFAMNLKRQREEWAAQKAEEVSQTYYSDMKESVQYLRERLALVDSSLDDVNEKRNAVIHVLRNPFSGLNRNEANMLLSKLMPAPSRAVTDSETASSRVPVVPALRRNSRSRRSSSGSAAAYAASTAVSAQGPQVDTQSYSLTAQLDRLEEYVAQVRKTTVMRDLLETLSPSELASSLLQAFEQEIASNVAEEDKEKERSAYVPMSLCYTVLKNFTRLRLNKVQLIAVMSWADCFEEGGLGVDYKAFARYAADVISKMYQAGELEKRAEVVSRVHKLDNKMIVGELDKDTLERYLARTLSEAQDPRGTVNEMYFLEVLTGIPEVKLSSKEAATIAAVAPRESDGFVRWKEFLPWAYQTIHEICEERLIGRRMALFAAASEEGDVGPLEQLADRLIGFARLKQEHGRPMISFPTDDANDKDSKRPTAQRIMKSRGSNTTPSGDKSRRSASANSAVNLYSGMESRPKNSLGELPRTSTDGENNVIASCDLIRLGRMVPLFEKKTLIGSKPLLLRVMENDVVTYPDRAPLQIIATSLDLSFRASIPLTIRMPSIGLVDKEAAEQFVLNIISKLILSQTQISANKKKIELLLETEDGLADLYTKPPTASTSPTRRFPR